MTGQVRTMAALRERLRSRQADEQGLTVALAADGARLELKRARTAALTFPNATPAEQEQLRARARAAVRRNAVADTVAWRYQYLVGRAVTALGLTGGLLYLLAEGIPAVGGLAGFAVGGLVVSRLGFPGFWLPGPLRRLAGCMLAALPLSLLWMLRWHPDTVLEPLRRLPLLADPQLLEQFALGVLLRLSRFLLARPLAWADGRFRRRATVRQPLSTPYDELITQWIHTVNRLADSGPTWPSAADIEGTGYRLAVLAVHARRGLQLRHLDLAPADRRRLKAEAAQVRTGILAHRTALLAAGAGAPYETVVDSLREGLAALLVGDRARLLKDLPVRSARATVQDFLRRIFPGVVLAAAGIGLPLIPAVSHQAELAANLRVTLLVTAVLSLISAPEGVTGQIDTALAKALPWKRD